MFVFSKCLTFIAFALVEVSFAWFNVVDFGAIGDGITDNTQVFRKVSELVKLNNGGEIFVPKGLYITGGFSLYSHTTLTLEANATLYASDNVDNYFCVPSITWDTGVCDYALLNIVNSTNIHLQGPGIIDGGANSPPGHLVKSYDEANNFFYPIDLPFPECSPFNCRIKLIVFYNTSNIIINNQLQLLNSPFWTLQFGLSSYIEVEDTIIHADRRWPNNDGIDIVSSHHVKINRCDISTGDDAVDLSTHIEGEDTHHIVVSNSLLQTTSAAHNIGMFVISDIYNAHFINNTIINTNRGLSIIARMGSGNIYNISYENILLQTQYFSMNWWGSAEPIYITGLAYNESTSYTGKISHIFYRNISANSTNTIMMRVNKESSISNVHFEDVKISVSSYGNVSRPCHDWRPGPGDFSSPISSMIDGLWMGDNDDGSYINSVAFDALLIENVVKEGEGFWGSCFNHTNIDDLNEAKIRFDEQSSCRWTSSV